MDGLWWARLLRRPRCWPALLVVAVALVVPSAASASQTIVSLEFDDTWRDQHSIRPLLSELGLRATFFVNSGFIGKANRMSSAQVQDLAADGHEIGGHTIDHADLVTLTLDERRREVCNDRVALMEAGFPVESFAYPYGNFDDQTKEIVERAVTTARARSRASSLPDSVQAALTRSRYRRRIPMPLARRRTCSRRPP